MVSLEGCSRGATRTALGESERRDGEGEPVGGGAGGEDELYGDDDDGPLKEEEEEAEARGAATATVVGGDGGGERGESARGARAGALRGRGGL